MNVIKVARIPPILAKSSMTVYEAVETMAQHGVGAVIIADEDRRILGIFTERDNLLRVTLKRRDPSTTLLTDVMTKDVNTAAPDMSPEEALARMLHARHRHLPIVDGERRVLGVLSVRQLLLRRLTEVENDNETLSAYVSSGGPG